MLHMPLATDYSALKPKSGHGLCLNLRFVVQRVQDLSLHSNCCVRALCCGRGTLMIYAADKTHPTQTLSTFDAKPLYKKMRTAMTAAHGRQVYY
jgi:hypothetical protein